MIDLSHILQQEGLSKAKADVLQMYKYFDKVPV